MSAHPASEQDTKAQADQLSAERTIDPPHEVRALEVVVKDILLAGSRES